MRVSGNVSVVVRSALTVGVLLGAAGCDRGAAEVTIERSAVTATITISGGVTDAAGLPLAGVTVHLDGTSQAVQVTTSSGSYSFSGLKAGSYSVRPTLNNCSFVPDVVNLNNLTTDAVQNFGGSGAACGGTATVNTGARTGPFTISGHVRDGSGRAIVGARITLGGAAQALRFSDITGSYTFHVAAGTYSLAASGDCALTPSNVNLNNLAASVVQDFQATANTCLASAISNVNPAGAMFSVTRAGSPAGVVLASIEARASNALAVSRLQDIASELATVSTRSLTIGGLPALERQATIAHESEHGPPQPPLLWLTTGIATGTSVVRFESQLPANASSDTINTFFAAGRNFSPEAMPGLHGPARATIPAAPRVAPATAALPSSLSPQPLQSFFGELSLAASESNTLVIGTNTGNVFRSPDGGKTFFGSSLNIKTIGNTFGDPSVVVSAPTAGTGSQNFYYTTLQQTGGTSTTPLIQIMPFQSTDQGVNFNQRTTPVDCSVAANACQIPDQEQLAADRFTQSSLGDRVYVAWRHTNGGNAPAAIGVSCSSDGGNSWTPQDITSLGKGGADFPRMAVGQDGSLFVLYETGSNTGTITLWMAKFSSCDQGFTEQPGFPVKVVQSGIKEIPSSLAGIDRAMWQGPFMVAPDDSDTSGNRVFAVYIEQVSVSSGGAFGNANVRVAESTNGGTSWTLSPTPINTVSTGNRFLPWVCSSNGIAYVTWYDRRDVDLNGVTDPTAYFRSSVSDPTNSGTPIVGTEVDMSGGKAFDDPQCRSGFFPDNGRGVRDINDELYCGDLPTTPVVAGRCTSTCPSGSTGPCGSLIDCDFRGNGCTISGETCTVGRGVPKYGDYNGSACAGGQLFMAWSSAVVPQGVHCALLGGACTTSADCCAGAGTCSNSICGPAGCSANGASCTVSATCCSKNCFGGTCQPGVALFTSSTAVTAATGSCTTAAPDETVSAPFEFDSGDPPLQSIGASYGSADCPGQFLVDIDMTQPGFSGKGLFVVGRWSDSLPTTPCDETATMTVFVTADGTNWQTRDTVSYAGMAEPGGGCHEVATNHTDPHSTGLGGTSIGPSEDFQRVRVAITALEGSTVVPVNVFGETNTN
jgi:hypothetical protein